MHGEVNERLGSRFMKVYEGLTGDKCEGTTLYGTLSCRNSVSLPARNVSNSWNLQPSELRILDRKRSECR